MALGGGPERRLLSEADEALVLAAIRGAEARTSAEIRVHVEARTKDALADARRWFERLGMGSTAARNGVLFFFASRDHRFAVVGDRGIHEHVGSEYWERLSARLAERLHAGEVGAGIEEAILDVGRHLAEFFPRAGSDANELPDSVSFGDDLPL
jgi:uncharacterized membrane protein